MEKFSNMSMLDAKDAKKAWGDIEKILSMAEILTEVEDIKLEKMAECRLRDDEEGGMKNKGGYIAVPKVVGE